MGFSNAIAAVAFGLVVVLAEVPGAWCASTSARAVRYAAVESCGGNDRLCLAWPDKCSTSGNCMLAMTVRKDPADAAKYLFEMSAQQTAYVAVALAGSTEMGDDSVVECIVVPGGSEVKLYQSMNSAHHPKTGRWGNTRLPAEAQAGVKLVKGTFADGVITCTFSRDQETVVNGTQYDLSTGSWVLQTVAGDKLNDDTSLQHHVAWVKSPEKIKLSATGLVDGSSGKTSSASAASISATTTALTVLFAVAAVLAS